MEKRILEMLENDAHATTEHIAATVGLPVTEVARIIQQAERERVILKYKALINWNKVKDEHVLALIEVKVNLEKDTGFDSVAERIYSFPQTRTVYLISGTYDLFVLVDGKNNQEVAQFVSQKLSRIEGVQSTVTQFVLKQYKEDGEVIAEKEEVKRQQVLL